MTEMLDQQVVIEKLTESVDENGSLTESWATLATIWAAVVALRGRELMDRTKVNSVVQWRFRIRWRDDVTPKMRLSWRGDTYDIAAVLDARGRREYLDLMCVRRES